MAKSFGLLLPTTKRSISILVCNQAMRIQQNWRLEHPNVNSKLLLFCCSWTTWTTIRMLNNTWTTISKLNNINEHQSSIGLKATYLDYVRIYNAHPKCQKNSKSRLWRTWADPSICARRRPHLCPLSLPTAPTLLSLGLHLCHISKPPLDYHQLYYIYFAIT